MNLLLDTHIILWWLDNNSKLPEYYKNLISDNMNLCFVSSASIWEISIKVSIGKLVIPANYLTLLKEQDFRELLINWEHADLVLNLPMNHRDPFDRILIAQCIIEDYTFLTVDKIFKTYDLKIMNY